MKTTTKLNETTLFTANLSLTELKGLGDMNLDQDKVAGVLSDAESLMCSALYLESRANGAGHEQAMASANGKMTKIKKAIGYTQPKVDHKF